MSYTTNHEELIIDEEMGNETQSDAGAKMSTSSPSKNIKVDIDDEKEEAALQALLNEMDSEINKDIKQDENDKENEEFEQLSNGTPDGEVNADSADKIAAGTSSAKDKYIKSENYTNFDAYTDGVNIHRKYALRTKVKPVIKTDSKKSTHENLDDAPSYYCSKCKKSFDSKTGLLNHLRMHKTEKVYTCSLCDEKFEMNKQLLTHKLIHEGEDRVFLCKTCEMAFTDHCDYLIHEISHTKRSTYKCPECGSYQTPQHIKTHIEQHFNRSKNCEQCGKLCKTNSALNKHVADYHEGKNRIECGECGKMCLDKKAYEFHMAEHTGIKKVQCFYCGKGFTRAQARNTHMRTHTDERPYSCDECPRTFRQEIDLKRHKMTHGEKTFECHMCNKKYLHSESLRFHMLMHNKKNLLHCPICNKGCNTRTGLRTHVLYKHSTERAVRCDLCDLSFKDESSIRRHRDSKAHKRAEYAARNKTEVEI